jgi:hypothetical protein
LAIFFLCPSQQFLPTSSKFSCIGIPARVIQYSGYERIVVYFAPNIQSLGLILIVFFKTGKIVGG